MGMGRPARGGGSPRAAAHRPPPQPQAPIAPAPSQVGGGRLGARELGNAGHSQAGAAGAAARARACHGCGGGEVGDPMETCRARQIGLCLCRASMHRLDVYAQPDDSPPPAGGLPATQVSPSSNHATDPGTGARRPPTSQMPRIRTLLTRAPHKRRRATRRKPRDRKHSTCTLLAQHALRAPPSPTRPLAQPLTTSRLRTCRHLARTF